MHKTSAWPLSLIYTLLVVYASLYPFTDWRWQGVAPWAFLVAPLPRYWTAFDLITNLIGYVPLGCLLAVVSLRSAGAGHAAGAIVKATAMAGGLSLVMESLQNYLPVRVPSNVDLALNLLGGGLGAVAAVLLARWGVIDRWSQFRARWFVPHARGALVLLALWPFALLFPAAVPLGLGHVMERLEASLAQVLANTPFLVWLPVRDVELQPLVPGMEMLCVLLGALLPVLLGYSIIPKLWRRAVFLGVLLLLGSGASTLSAALSYGPEHAWAWLTLPVQVGVVAGLVLALLALPVPMAGCTGLLLLVLVLHASLLNGAPASAYFAQTLQTWEQGRFIRFNGLAQWVGWLWPYVALLYVLTRISFREKKMPRSHRLNRRREDRLLKSAHDLPNTHANTHDINTAPKP
jgi:VanZ family protein